MSSVAQPVTPRKLSRAGKRQLVLIGAVSLLVMAVIMLTIKLAENNAPAPKAPKVKAKKTTIAAPGSVPEETVAAVTERRLAELQATIKLQDAERDKRIKEAEARAQRGQEKERLSTDGSTGTPRTDEEEVRAPTPRLKLFDATRMGTNDRARAQQGRALEDPGLPQEPKVPTVTTMTFGTQPSDPDPQLLATKKTAGLLDPDRAVANYEEVGAALRSRSTKSLAAPKVAHMTSETHLPSGTFFKVSTMNGMDAPAGGQAQNNPQPVLMMVSDWGNMPNSFRANVKHCFVIGSAWGDLSAERAMARTETLSCIRPNGDVIDVPIAGFVVGPDGRNGFRGRVVTKQGQVLANALWTGTLGAFGDVAKELNKSSLVVASGVLTQESPGTAEVLRRGALGGMGEAAKSLSQYYINLADKLYPVIETDAGLTAEVVLTRGVSIKVGQGQGAGASGANVDLNGWAQALKLK